MPVYLAHKSEIDFSDPDPISAKIEFTVMGLYNLAVYVSYLFIRHSVTECPEMDVGGSFVHVFRKYTKILI